MFVFGAPCLIGCARTRLQNEMAYLLFFWCAIWFWIAGCNFRLKVFNESCDAKMNENLNFRFLFVFRSQNVIFALAIFHDSQHELEFRAACMYCNVYIGSGSGCAWNSEPCNVYIWSGSGCAWNSEPAGMTRSDLWARPERVINIRKWLVRTNKKTMFIVVPYKIHSLFTRVC